MLLILFCLIPAHFNAKTLNTQRNKKLRLCHNSNFKRAFALAYAFFRLWVSRLCSAKDASQSRYPTAAINCSIIKAQRLNDYRTGLRFRALKGLLLWNLRLRKFLRRFSPVSGCLSKLNVLTSRPHILAPFLLSLSPSD